MEQYKAVDPSFPERIFRAFEKQTDHRIKQEDRVIRGNVISQYIGATFGFVIAMTGLVGGMFLINAGVPGFGIAAVITSVGGPVSAFFYGKRKQEKEREARIKMLEERARQDRVRARLE